MATDDLQSARSEMRDHLTSEVGEALDVVVREASIAITAPAGVSVRPLTPHPLDLHGSRTVLRLGDLVAGQEARAVLRLRFPEAAPESEAGVLFAMADADGVMATTGTFEPQGLSWRSVTDGESRAQARDVAVDRIVAELFAARARQEAVALNRNGDWPDAARAVRDVAERITSYAGTDPAMLAIASELRVREAQKLAAPMAELDRKQMHATAAYQARFRDPFGKSKKGS